MNKWKKAVVLGSAVGFGVYAVVKHVLPKISVLCIHDEEKEKEQDKQEPDKNSVCDCEHCSEKNTCDGYVAIHHVELDELPKDVQDFLGHMFGEKFVKNENADDKTEEKQVEEVNETEETETKEEAASVSAEDGVSESNVESPVADDVSTTSDADVKTECEDEGPVE